MISLYLLCAGSGSRFGSKLPKSLCVVDGKEMFLHSLQTFLKIKKIDNFFLVVDKKQKNNFIKVLTRENIKNVKLLFGSRVSRHQSLVSAIKQSSPLSDDILITHDCARVGVTQKIINENIGVALKHGFASTQLSVVDSLFKKNKSVYKPVPREDLFQIQTPQTFKFSLWSQSNKKNTKITDVFSFLNVKVKDKNVVVGSLKNYKITFESDLN